MKLANVLLIMLLATGINGAYGADTNSIPHGKVTTGIATIDEADRLSKIGADTTDECKRMLESLTEKLTECQAGRRKEFEAYQRILRDNGLLPPEKK